MKPVGASVTRSLLSRVQKMLILDRSQQIYCIPWAAMCTNCAAWKFILSGHTVSEECCESSGPEGRYVIIFLRVWNALEKVASLELSLSPPPLLWKGFLSPGGKKSWNPIQITIVWVRWGGLVVVAIVMPCHHNSWHKMLTQNARNCLSYQSQEGDLTLICI